MAKKPKKKGAYHKDISEMDDTEFVKNIDYLSSPYYRAYINARVQAELGYDAWKDGVDMREAEKANSVGKKKRYGKKRGVAVLLIALLMLAMAALGVIGLAESAIPTKYFAVLVVPGATEEVTDYICLTDPVMGLFGKDARKKSAYFSELAEDKLEDAQTMTKIAVYSVPVASLLLFICGTFGFLKSLVSIFGRKNNGGYHKYKFGFASIVMLMCAAIVIFGVMYAAGMVVDGVADFFTFKSNVLRAGYGTYAIMIIPIITFILSCVSYKKTTVHKSAK